MRAKLLSINAFNRADSASNDELTTGLHFVDIRLFLNVLQEVVDRGNTVLVIGRNPHVRKVADYYCDMGPERGSQVGRSFLLALPKR